MANGKKRPTYRFCPQCGGQNRIAFHCCHYCGYVFAKTSEKLRLTTAEIGMIVGATLGLACGLLLWDELRLLGIMLFFFGGGFGYSLCSGSKATVRSALTGFVVGAILGIFGIIVQGGYISLAQIMLVLFFLSLSSALAWKGIFMGTHTVRIGGVVGALVGIMIAVFIVLTRSNDIIVGMALIAIYGAFLGAILGMGVVYSPRAVVGLGIVSGIAVWVWRGGGPSSIIELPEQLVWGLIAAGGYFGLQRVFLEPILSEFARTVEFRKIARRDHRVF